jgi:20S proteasome alpha/beta subunit
MTLIAAFRTKEGVAICADSQETVPRHDGYEDRKTVQKISPITTDRYQVVIAGSGDAVLIEAFIILAERRIEGDTEPASIKRVLTVIEDELGKFYEKHIDKNSGYPISLFIAATCLSTKEYEVWVAETQYLRPLRDAELIGYDASMYWVTTGRLYRKDMTLPQAILAAVYVLVIGEESSNYIKGPFSLAVVRENGIWVEDSSYVDDLKKRLSTLEEHTNKILLACADTSIYSPKLRDTIAQFSTTAKSLHEQYIEKAVAQSLIQGGGGNDAVPKVPPGIMVEILSSGKYIVHHDKDGRVEMVKRVNEAFSTVRDEEALNDEEEEVKP